MTATTAFDLFLLLDHNVLKCDPAEPFQNLKNSYTAAIHSSSSQQALRAEGKESFYRNVSISVLMLEE